MRLPLARVLAAVLLAGACTRDLSVPPPPDPARPGTIQGTIVYAQAGLSVLQAANGASVELVGTQITAKADTTGHFLLSPIATNIGAMLVKFDADGDGKVDHQRIFDLQDIGAGPAHDISLDQIRLGENAVIRGTVLRADISATNGGHAGTAVFVPEGPYTVYSGDNGSFTLENLPEGNITLAFFRPGYDSTVAHVSLRAGEVFSLATVLLTPQPGMPPPVKVSGFALLAGLTTHAGTTVTIGGIGATTTTDAAGHFVFPEVPRGFYSFGFEHDTYSSVVLTNVVIDGTSVDLPAVTLVKGDSMPPNLDGGFMPGDAGAVEDAGTPDAGTPDAGTPDAGTPDAGTPDAGTPDAGEPDAGPVDAGFDAGPAPMAVISPVPPFVSPNTQFSLHGDMSTGPRPFTYHWRQDAGTTVNIANNDSALSATPTFFTPSTAGVLHFGLTVTDTYGRTSSPAEVNLVIAGQAPTCTIVGAPMNAFAGQILTLSSTANDPSGSGIAQYSWSVMPSSIVATPKNGGAQVDLAMPASVPTPIAVTVQLSVTNGLGITSTTASVTFSLTTMVVQPWYVDAGSVQVVNGGQLVTLNGLAVTPGFTGATFSYLWSPSQTPDASTPDWMLTTATSPISSFVAPLVVGANRPLPFTLTANVTASGLMPTQNVGSTLVIAQDATPPHVVATSIDSNGYGGQFSMWVDFDEPINFASNGNVSISVPNGASYGAANVILRSLDPSNTRLWLTIRNASVGNAYILNVSGWRDLSPQANTQPPQTFPFLVANPWSPVSVSQQSSGTEPRPALVVRPVPSNPKVLQALVAARKGSQPWFLAPFDPLACEKSPCAFADDTSMPTASLSPQLIRGHRSLLLGNGTAVVQLQVRDYSGDAGVAYTRDFSTGWTLLPAPPGQLVPRYDGGLAAAYAQNGLFIAAYDQPSQTWGLADAGTLSMSATDFPNDSASDPLVQASAGPPSYPLYLVGRTSKTGQLRFFENSFSANTWASDCCGVTTGSPVVDMRTVGLSGAAFETHLRQSGALEIVLWGGPSNGATNFVPQPVTAFDTADDPSSTGLWIASSSNGQLQVQLWNLPGSGTWTYLPGPDGGVVAPYLNNDPTCWADSPELALLYGKLYVAWQERCGAGPWKVYVRTLN